MPSVQFFHNRGQFAMFSHSQNQFFLDLIDAEKIEQLTLYRALRKQRGGADKAEFPAFVNNFPRLSMRH